MTDRYWAPQRATIEPDAVVLAMLEPGDIGASVLAVHRAGAAAMETVSKGPVPSEQGLIEALVAVRAAVADKVVDSVAKSADPAYAGLFVMDVFDDAESGAMHIYRTSISKGVAPPLAAQRAADVFGVPSTSMGKYAQSATDPKGNPIAIRDLADRTLLEYASRVAESEKQPVSKTDGPQYQEEPAKHKPWREDEVVRDAIGRFAEETTTRPTRRQKDDAMARLRAQLGLTGSAPAEVAGVPTAEEKQAPKHRLRRTQRVHRAEAKRAEVQRAEPKRAEAKRYEPLRGKAKRQAISRAASRREAAATNRAALRRLEEQGKSKALVPTKVTGDLLSVRPGYEQFNDNPSYELDHEIVLRTDISSGDSLREALRVQANRFKDPGAWVLRIGYLTDISAKNTTAERPGSKHDIANLDSFSSQVVEAADTVHQDVEIIHSRDITNSGETEQDYIEGRRRAKATIEYTTREGQNLWVPDKNEDQYTFAMPIYRPYGWDETQEEEPEAGALGEHAIVRYLPPDPNRPDRRPIPAIDEFVLLGQPRGYEERTTGTTAYELDPNQPYRFVPPPQSPKGALVEAEKLWDGENGIMINRWYLRQIDEDDVDELQGNDVTKADEPQYQRAPKPNWRESDVVRDMLGRFAEEADRREQAKPEEPAVEQREAPARRVQRVQRIQRVQRVQRHTPARAADVARAEPKRAEVTRAAVQRTPFQRALQRAATQRMITRAKGDPDMPMLYDANDFKVFTEHQWRQAIDLLDDDETRILFGGGEVQLNPITRRAFAEATVLNINELPTQLAVNVDNDPSLRTKQFQHLAYLPVAQAKDYDVLADRIESIFDAHPEVDKIEMVRRGDVLALSGNLVGVGHQSIVEVDPEIDWERPVVLTYVGQYRARELGTRSQRGDIEALISATGTATGDNVEGVVANPEVHLYRIATRHWRAGN